MPTSPISAITVPASRTARTWSAPSTSSMTMSNSSPSKRDHVGAVAAHEGEDIQTRFVPGITQRPLQRGFCGQVQWIVRPPTRARASASRHGRSV